MNTEISAAKTAITPTPPRRNDALHTRINSERTALRIRIAPLALRAALRCELGVGRARQLEEHRLQRVALRGQHPQHEAGLAGSTIEFSGTIGRHVDDQLVLSRLPRPPIGLDQSDQ